MSEIVGKSVDKSNDPEVLRTRQLIQKSLGKLLKDNEFGRFRWRRSAKR